MKPLSIPGTRTNGWIVLIGGGEFSFGETREIDQYILARVPSDRRSVAFLPTASGSVEYGLHFGNYLRTLEPGLEVVNVPVYRLRDGRRGRNLATIREAGLIYIGGGVIENLLGVLNGSPVVEALHEALQNNAVVAGIGAGASALGGWTAGESGGALEALGLVPECAVVAGFNPADDSSLRRLMSLPDVALGIGVPPVAALAIGPDRMGEIVGDEPVAVMRRSSQ